MKIFKELESLGFFEWLSEVHDLKDTDITPKYLDDLPLSDIHTTVANSMVFRWVREKYNINSWIQPFVSGKSNGVLYLPDESYSYFIFKDGVWVDDKVDFLEPEEAELACIIKLIEIIKNKRYEKRTFNPNE